MNPDLLRGHSSFPPIRLSECLSRYLHDLTAVKAVRGKVGFYIQVHEY